MSLRILFYLSLMLLLSCNNEVKKPAIKSNAVDKNIKEPSHDSIVDDNQDAITDNHSEFSSAFPVVDHFPSCKELTESSYDFDQREAYSEFSNFVKWNIFTDASESPWYYQPLLKFQYGENAYVLVAIEYDEENEVERYHLIRQEVIWSEYSEEYFLGLNWEIVIAEKKDDTIIKEYEFLNNSFDSVLFKTKNEPDAVLRRFDDNFSNINRFFKLTRKEIRSFPNAYNADKVFPYISNSWSAQNQLDSIINNDVKRFLEFSKYIHLKTNLDKTYKGNKVNNVPYIFPLGVKTVYDSLKLYVVYSEYIENNEVDKTIKMFLCDGDLTRLVDYKSFSCSDGFNSDLEYSDNTFYFIRDDNIKIPMDFNYSGILPEKGFFEKLISNIDETRTPLTLFAENLMEVDYVYADGLNAFLDIFAKKEAGSLSCFGKVETNSKVLILLNSADEITSGEHFVIDSYYAAVFNKKNGAFIHNVLLNSNFDGVQSYITSNSVLLFPGGEENYELIHGEDGNLYPAPNDTLRITNYGFVKYYHVFPYEKRTDSSSILAWFKSYKSPNLLEISDFKCVENDTLRIFSNLLNSLIFNENEDYIVKYFPESFREVNDSMVYMEWKRLDPHNYLYESFDYNYIKESAVYNINTHDLSEIKRLK